MPSIRTNKQLAQRQLTTTSVTALYTVPGQTTEAYVKMIAVTNTTNTSKTYSIWINQGGTATGDGFAFCGGSSPRTISANATDTFIFPGDAAIVLNGDNLHSSASIMCQASAGSALTFHLHGFEIVQT